MQEALAEAERRATKDARGQGRDIDKKEGQGKEGEGAAGEGSGLNEASGLPPAPPHALLDILGQRKQYACARTHTHTHTQMFQRAVRGVDDK
jgi:hypothetical protein